MVDVNHLHHLIIVVNVVMLRIILIREGILVLMNKDVKGKKG